MSDSKSRRPGRETATTSSRQGHPTIMIVVSEGHMARIHLHSGVVNRLVEMGAKVVVLNPMGGATPFREDLAPEVVFDEVPLPLHRLHSHLFLRMYMYLFATYLPTGSNRIRESMMREQNPRRHAIVQALKGWPADTLLRLAIGSRRLLMPARLYDSVFKKHQPDLVVVGTMGRCTENYFALRRASQLGVPSVCTVQSWDFLSMKDYPLERPDKLIVWNEPNKAEAQQLHGFQEEDVWVSGVPHFDFYFDDAVFESREQWCSGFGLNPQRATITIACQPSHSRPRVLNDLISTLADAINNDRLVRPSQVIVRPHPAVYAGETPGEGTEEDLKRFEAMSPHIHGNRPRMSSAGIGADTHTSEHVGLANLLRHSDVVLDFFGTISIEACAVDTPVIYVDLRSPTTHDDPEHWTNNLANYDHIRYVVDLQGARICSNANSLIETTNRYLGDPTLDQHERKKVVNLLCFKADGRSALRLAEALYSYSLGDNPPLPAD